MTNTFNILYIYKFMRFLARYLTCFFVPVLIYQKTNSIPLALLYLVMTSISVIIFSFLIKKDVEKHTRIYIILSAFVFTIIQVLLLIDNINIILYSVILGILSGIDNVLTLSTIDLLYNKRKGSEKEKNLRNNLIIEISGQSIAPIIGGFIIEYLGTIYNVGLAILICISAVIFICIEWNKITNPNIYDIKDNKINEEKDSNKMVNSSSYLIKTNYKELKNYNNNQNKTLKREMLFMSIMLMLVAGILMRMVLSWSLYLDIIGIKIVSIGMLSGLVSIAKIICTLITYKIQTKHNSLPILIISAVVISLSWILRLYVNDIVTLYITTILIGFLYPFIFQPIKQIYLIVSKSLNKKSILYTDTFLKQAGALIITLIGLAFSLLGIYGLQIMYIFSCACILVSPIIYYFLEKKIATLKKVNKIKQSYKISKITQKSVKNT